MRSHSYLASVSSLFACFLLAASSWAQGQIFAGRNSQDYYGNGMAMVGDVNQDGWSDLLIGAPSQGFAALSQTGYAELRSGKDGTLLRTLRGKTKADHYGFAVAGVGDLNGDKIPDLAIGIPRSFFGSQFGTVELISGKDGTTFLTLKPKVQVKGDEFGTVVASAGDVDKDGVVDLVVGAPFSSKKTISAGSAYVFSGRTGAQLYVWHGDAPLDRFGSAVAGLGDINQDGYDDILVGAPQAVIKWNGYARVYSGRDGTLLFKLSGLAPGDYFGTSVIGLADLNQDSVPDFAIGSPQTDSLPLGAGGYVQAFSGKDAKLLWTSKAARRGDGLGRLLVIVGDVNGDGVADLAASAVITSLPSTPAYVSVLNTINGRSLQRLSAQSKGDGFGLAMVGVGDWNDDGLPDLAIASPTGIINARQSGFVQITSAWPLSLTSKLHSVSVITGGRIDFELTAGAARAGRLYVVLGSTSGIYPGIALPPVTIPLKADVYFSMLLGNPNAWILPSVGLLDAGGKALASFHLPRGLGAQFVGLRLHHAFVSFDSQLSGIDFASNPLRLSLIK